MTSPSSVQAAMEAIVDRLLDDPGFDAWSTSTAFTDADGCPRVLFHGTLADRPFNVFAQWKPSCSFGFHFGTLGAAEDRICEMRKGLKGPEEDRAGGTIIPVVVRAENPLRLEDCFNWSPSVVAAILWGKGLVDEEEELDFLRDACLEHRGEVYLMAALELAGYDSIEYRNDFEAREEKADSVIVWRAEMVKSIHAGVWDMDNPRLVPQVDDEDDDIDVRAWRDLAERIDEAKKEILEFRKSRHAAYAFG